MCLFNNAIFGLNFVKIINSFNEFVGFQELFFLLEISRCYYFQYFDIL